ncbi:hypothetical protein ACQYBH_002952 [Salmonella enterica]|nr:hypothetical protein [Salmonella enterica subsp. enterica serovar Coleypark]EHI6295211.1 hypothetical protein [Salmonella enterica]ECI2454390.1 hypothetical protein [Salmonella enterica subsp. enterica serovar Coleypark]EDU1087119.1 hypothetical protein [Salmonella enterica subsp. enterica serovar Coleypark]EDV0316858.1 hypothetical protein [Salmonella enterica subsp. enterica serovar Coleypark]
MTNSESITIKNISAGSIYKLQFLGFCCSLVPLGVINGLLSAIGINLFILHWNGEPINGLSSIIISPIYFFVLALILSGFIGSFVWLGLWIHSRFRTLNLHIFPANRQS